jgi:hypothetical protein
VTAGHWGPGGGDGREDGVVPRSGSDSGVVWTWVAVMTGRCGLGQQ